MNMCDDDIQMTATLILVCFDLQLGHHFTEGAGIDTTHFLDTDTDICRLSLMWEIPQQYNSW
jgi:hypothetical protein